VSASIVPLVETARVRAVELLHGGGEHRGARVHDQVVVRIHQAAGDDSKPMPPRHPLEQVEEVDAVEIDEEDPVALDPAGGDVEVPVRQVTTTDSRLERR
jgi:hypothetical protein